MQQSSQLRAVLVLSDPVQVQRLNDDECAEVAGGAGPRTALHARTHARMHASPQVLEQRLGGRHHGNAALLLKTKPQRLGERG